MTAETRQTKTLAQLYHPTPLRLFASIVHGRAWPYAIGLLAMVMTSASEVLIPKLVQYAIDILAGTQPLGVSHWFVKLLGTDSKAALFTIVAMMVGLMTTGMIGRFGWRQFLARQTHEVGSALKIGVWDVLRHQPIHTFRKYSLGDLMNRAIGDWQASRVIFGFTLVLAFDVIFFSAFAVVAMLWIDVPLTLLTLAVFLATSPIISKLARQEHDLHESAQEQLSDLSDAITQSLRSIRFQRATHSESSWQSQLRRLSQNYREARLKVIKTAWKIFPWSSLPALFGYTVLATLGISRVAEGIITPGQLVALCSFVLLMQTPLLELGDCIAEMQKGFASLRRMQEILNLSRPHEGLFAEPRPQNFYQQEPAIAFNQVSFAYPGGTKLLDSANWSIPQGSVMGLIGSIGIGKTTLLQLLAGFEQPLSGSIDIFGRQLGDVDRSWFAQHVAMVPQTAFLFAGTIRDNLCLNQSFGDEKLWQILDAVCIRKEIEQMPSQLDTGIGEWGINLSGGQKQRLALARALLRDLPLLLLDDCLSAVDALTEEEILKHILQRPNQTVVWSAHRASTLRHCHKIWTIHAGQIQEVTTDIRKDLSYIHKDLS